MSEVLRMGAVATIAVVFGGVVGVWAGAEPNEVAVAALVALGVGAGLHTLTRPR